MPALIALLLVLGQAGAAAAHGGEEHGVGPVWTFDPWVVVPAVLLGGLYGWGSARLASRSRGRAGLAKTNIVFWSGWIVLTGALVSPLHFLGEHVFTFHMIEHELVMAVAAPLLVLARPIGVLLWGLPRAARRGIMRVVKARPVSRAWDVLTQGTVATVLHGVAIWVWHVPAFFDASITVVALHRLQHLSFLLTALCFWWAVIWKVGRGSAGWHVFVTMMHTSVLGALIALAPRVVYVSQTQAASEWGMTPLQDQQLAGLVMWVPGGIVYAGVALAMLASWIAASSRGAAYASRIR